MISSDRYNRSRLATVTVVVLTSNLQLAGLPGNVQVSADLVADLDTDSVINVTQIATIDRTAVDELIGPLPEWLMVDVDAGLARALELSRPLG